MKSTTEPPQDSVTDASDAAFLIRQMKATATLADFFLRGEKSQRLYDLLSGLITDVLQLKGCLVLDKQQKSNSYLLYSACGLCDPECLESTNWPVNKQFEVTLDAAEVITVEDYVRSDHFFPPDRECFSDFRSGMSVSIPGENGPRGIIAVYHMKPRHYSKHEKEFLKTVSNMLAGALSRDENESELRESEARSLAILDTAVDGIITIDTKGQITLFNQAAQHIFGYAEEEVLGKNISMLMPEPYRREHNSYMHNYKATGTKKIIGSGREMTGLRKDGKTFPLYLAVSEIYIGNVRHFTGIVRDISDQRRLEQEVLKISDHERRRIGQDLHDGLGQMLTGIGLMSQSLRKKLEREHSGLADQAAEITRLIREADEYAKNLSRGLLPVDFEVRGLVTSMERLAANAERLFGISCTFREENPPVFHDSSVVEHLFRIAQEAISNAVKHGRASKVSLELYSNEEFASLRVFDNGKGFAGNWHDKKGSGMDIMQFRAQLIGANLDVRNMEDGGAELYCILPRTEAMYHSEAG